MTSTRAPGPALPLVLPGRNNPEVMLRLIVVVPC
jgi:hypothetical protein